MRRFLKAKALKAFNISSKAIADALRTVVSALQSSPDIAIENKKLKIIGACILATQVAASVGVATAKNYVMNKMLSDMIS